MPDPLLPPADSQPPRGEIDLDLRRRFLRLGAEDCRLLAEMREPLARHAADLVEAFYQHLFQFEPVRHLLADAETIERLRRIQVDYVISLAAGPEREGYLADRQRVGRTHERIGLHPQWFLGAYGVYLDHLAPIVMDHFAPDAKRACRAMGTLTKMMILDAQIVLDAYFQTRQEKALERSEQLAAVGELAASIAHEVRNPLAGMKGAMEVLLRSLAVNERQREVMDEVVAQIVRLENLVRDLLTFARHRPLSRQRTDLVRMCEKVFATLEAAGELAGVALRRYLPPEVVVDVDPSMIEDSLFNLVQNAAHSLAGHAEAELTVAVKPGPSGVAITVTDNGPGIPRDVRRKIFDPFFTTKAHGTGLGLPITKKHIEAHGGRLRVRSAPGRRTTFEILLPLSLVSASEPAR